MCLLAECIIMLLIVVWSSLELEVGGVICVVIIGRMRTPEHVDA